MNKREENRYSMFRQVITELDKNPVEFTKYPGLVSAISEFKTLYANIAAKDDKYLTRTNGKLIDFELAEEKMVEAIMELAGFLKVIAKNEADNSLFEQVNFGVYDLTRMRDSNLAVKAESVYNAAQTNKSKLTAMNYTAEKLTDVKSKIDLFASALSDKENSYTEKTTFKLELNELFKMADDLLKEIIDDFMELYKTDNPTMYNNYFSARIVKNLGVRHTKQEEKKTEAPPLTATNS